MIYFSNIMNNIYTDINLQTYELNVENKTATILPNHTSTKIEIFPTITYLNDIYEVIFPNDCSSLFNYNDKLETFYVRKLLTPTLNIKNMDKIFSHCTSLKSIDISNLDIKNVLYMRCAFSHCLSLESIDLSKSISKYLVYLDEMFCSCINLKNINMPYLKTKTLKSIKYIFSKCYSLKSIDFSNANISIQRDCKYHLKSIKQINLDNSCVYDNSNITFEESHTVLANYEYVRPVYNNVYDINCNNTYFK